MNELLVLEFNEVNREILERCCQQGKLPNFSRLMQSGVVVSTKVQEEYKNLEPWIQWVTTHSGKTQSEHGAFNLSDVQHSELQQIWDVLESKGIACGLMSPMNARRGLVKKGFFIPDPWSTSHDAYPTQAESIYRFMAERVQSHNVSLEQGSSKFKFLIECIKLGTPLSSLFTLGSAYIAARIDKRKKWRLAALLDSFLFDLTMVLRDKFKTKYNSVFMNSVAHYQHHYWTEHDPDYWSAAYPKLFFHKNPVSRTNLHAGDDPILFGMQMMDRVVGKAIDAVGIHRVMVLTGLSQVPFEGYNEHDGFYLYRPLDHERLLKRLGIGYDSCSPLMSRDAMLFFKDEAQRAEAIAQMDQITVEGRPLFHRTIESDNRLFVKIAFTWPVKDSTCIVGPKTPQGAVKFNDELLLITFKTGHHWPEGMMIASKSLVPRDVQAQGHMPLTQVPEIILQAMQLNDSKQLAASLAASPVQMRASGNLQVSQEAV